MAKFDVENFMDEFVAKLKTNLAARVSAINTEKGDNPVLESFPDGAFIFQTLDEKALNFRDFVFYYIDDISGEINGPHASKDLTIEVDIFVYDRQDNLLMKRVLRYWRALEEAMALTWDSVGKGYDRAAIKSLTPIDVKLINSSEYHKVFGVSLNFAIG